MVTGDRVVTGLAYFGVACAAVFVTSGVYRTRAYADALTRALTLETLDDVTAIAELTRRIQVTATPTIAITHRTSTHLSTL